ncbi:hypothetical protein T265_01914 [Opisthorchis viverrini]|uniref:C2H2-type domain-containing protein n=1 Tax=Opisthorchis viverrini TaxID=6198 RepID=A0A075A8D5_OPIVI|nr:hypothetical protein T265_01914 [Opisthorchis viverrini]KER31985.1 hypothetical protein T265_01914 [Opisthorchis viverrini]
MTPEREEDRSNGNVPNSTHERLVELICEECGRCCKSKAGLAAHHRVHVYESVGTNGVVHLFCTDCFRPLLTKIN